MADNPFSKPTVAHLSSPSKSNKMLWMILAGVFIGVPTVCCGGLFLTAYFGLGILAADIEMQLRDHPAVQEHIGEIEELSINFTKSGATDDPDTFVYDIRGSKGEGELTITSVSNWEGNEEITNASLRLDDGQVIQIEFQAEAELQVP